MTSVRDYYDFNTRRWFTRRRTPENIHREVWADGVRSRSEAFQYVDQLVLREVLAAVGEAEPPPHVLDLGCGVGSTLILLAERAPIRGTGVTISPVQAAFAAERIQRAGLSGRLSCIEADYLQLPPSLAPAQIAFSIEAFIHAADTAAYFASAARALAPGGLLVICDDFLTEQGAGPLPRRASRHLDRLRRGWLASSLVTRAHADEHARRAGFVLMNDVDLTPGLRLRRPRDLVTGLVLPLGRLVPLPAWQRESLIGGHALQAALASGLVQFRFVVWRLNGGDRDYRDTQRPVVSRQLSTSM